jgi:hypothetical protein
MFACQPITALLNSHVDADTPNWFLLVMRESFFAKRLNVSLNGFCRFGYPAFADSEIMNM